MLAEKSIRIKQTRLWQYRGRQDEPLVRVVREDDGQGGRKIYQQRWESGRWQSGLRDIDRVDIPIYNYQAIQRAIASGKTIWVVEGETCCDALIELGLTATTNIGGSLKWQASDTADLQGAKEVVLCPDRDEKGIKHMEKIETALKLQGIKVRWMCAKPDSPFWKNAPKDRGLDVVDWIEEGATTGNILLAVSDQPVWRGHESAKATQSDSPSEDFDFSELDRYERYRTKKMELLQIYHYLKDKLGKRLCYNELGGTIEVDGQELDIDQAQGWLATKHRIGVGQATAANVILQVAKENTYNPVKDYLERVVSQVSVSALNDIDLERLSSSYLGTVDPIYDIFLKKTLIAAVARVYKPGCQVDTALILQGAQGIRKSTFFKTLGGQWFDDSMGDGQNKDDLLILHRCWIQEWGEIEKIFGKKQAADLKGFISKRIDSFRQPYARKTSEKPRMSIIVGSTNKTELLIDETGNRRFWIIPVQTPRIDTERLERERDAIWAAAVQAYRTGESWWLSLEEEALSTQNNEQYLVSDAWEEIIGEFVNKRVERRITIAEILEQALNFEPIDMRKADQMRVAAILTSMGWQKKLQDYQGKRRKIWVGPDDPLTTPQVSEPPLAKVGSTLKTLDSTPPEPLDPPDPPTSTQNKKNLSGKISLGDHVIYKGEKFSGGEDLFDSIGNPRVVSVIDIDESVAALRVNNSWDLVLVEVEKLEKWHDNENRKNHQKYQTTNANGFGRHKRRGG